MCAESKVGCRLAGVAALLLAVLLCIGSAGCGQKGDLYLPSEDEKSDRKR